MGFLVNKEIEGLKGDIELKNQSLDIEKYSFKRKLDNGFGEKMMNEIKNPPKSNFWLGMKIRFARWKKKREDKKRIKKASKDFESYLY